MCLHCVGLSWHIWLDIKKAGASAGWVLSDDTIVGDNYAHVRSWGIRVDGSCARVFHVDDHWGGFMTAHTGSTLGFYVGFRA